jgi:DNA-directed RNA polymerase subunit RPC12/RpoP
VSIVAVPATLVQEYRTTVYTTCKCPNCSRTYWKLFGDKNEYLSLYPHCANCGYKIQISDVVEDEDVIGAEVLFLQKGEKAYASFSLTHKALSTANIKQMIEKCDAKHIC